MLDRARDQRRGPLSPDDVLRAEGVQVSVGPPLDRLLLQGDPAAFAAVLALPTLVGTTFEQNTLACLCLGPAEWLTLAPLGDAIAAQLRAWDAPSGAAVEIGNRQAALLVSGPLAATLLNTGCPLDLHPSKFPAGRCTRSVLAKAEIVLWRRAPERFHVEVARSYAGYLWAFLQEAIRGLPRTGGR
jgi:sarcosine oxidase subunit gamma